jgi:hypothetical protein
MRSHFQSFFLVVCLGLSFVSCDNENSADCFKKTGDNVVREFSLESFHSIVVIDEMDVYLENGSNQRVEVIAGKNLIPEIHLEVKDSVQLDQNTWKSRHLYPE